MSDDRSGSSCSSSIAPTRPSSKFLDCSETSFLSELKERDDVLSKIRELLGTGTRQDEIMIVSMSGNDRSIMSERYMPKINVGNLKFVLGKEHDWSKLNVDTIVIGNVYALKGLDSKVVILTDVFTKVDREKALLVGVTTARSRLIIFQGKNIK